MSFVTAVRDYIDWINSSFDAFAISFGTPMSTFAFIKGTLIYLLLSVKVGVLYVITFQWIRDLAYLPVIIPQSTATILKEQLCILSIHTNHLFAFAESPTVLQNKFLIGFLNSFFCSLPLSCAHIIALRQFYCMNWRMGFATSGGIITANTFFLISIVFGWRGVLIPWLQFEPWNYVLGWAILLCAIREIYFQKDVAPWLQERFGGDQRYVRSAFYGFALTMCDQTFIFKHLSNLTLGLEPNFIEPLTSTAQNLLFSHVLYIFGFLVGSAVFTWLFFQFADSIRTVLTAPYKKGFTGFTGSTGYTVRFSRFSYLSLLMFAASTLPYYGLDFFITRPLGFVPYDTALTPGMFTEHTIMDRQMRILGNLGSFNRPDIDLASFDRGQYYKMVPGEYVDMRGTENYRIPNEIYWGSRGRRQARPYPLVRLKSGMFKTLRKAILMAVNRARGLESTPEEPKKLPPWVMTEEERELHKKERQKERIEGRKLFRNWARRGNTVSFDQFTIRDNIPIPSNLNGMHYDKDILTRLKNLRRRTQKIKNQEGRMTLGDQIISAQRIDSLEFGIEYGKKDGRDPRYKSQEALTSDIFLGPQFDEVTYDPYEDYIIHPTSTPDIYLGDPLLEIRTLAKLKYHLRRNPYFMTLMRTEIDGFLKRQPKSHTLSAQEEAELFYKRTMLKHYMNHWRRYKYMPNYSEFFAAYEGTKTFAHKVYNHQFQGTYKTVRRLFDVDFDPLRNPTHRRVNKYDMPLFDETKSHNPMIHEELIPQLNKVLGRRKPTKAMGFSIHDGSHMADFRDFSLRRYKQIGRKMDSFAYAKNIFVGSNTAPVYAGWDEKRRQFVLTNRLLPSALTSRRMKTPAKYPEFGDLLKFANAKNDKIKLANTKKDKDKKGRVKRTRQQTQITFTLWPISKRIINDPILWKSRRAIYSSDMPLHHNIRPVPSPTPQKVIEKTIPAYKVRAELTKRIKPTDIKKEEQLRLIRGALKELEKRQKAGRKEETPYTRMVKERNFVRRFLPEFDFKPIGDFYSALRTANRNEVARYKQRLALELFKQYRKFEIQSNPYFTQWPSGLKFVRGMDDEKWWMEEDPPTAFADRGGFVWPGHRHLKFNLQNIVPKIMKATKATTGTKGTPSKQLKRK